MAKTVIESDFQSSKMAAGGHFVKNLKKKLRIDLKWREMRSKVIFSHPKWPPTAILWKYDEKVCALHNLIKNTPINFIFDVATYLL